jgi:predicted AAA+ superfamily ATPase
MFSRLIKLSKERSFFLFGARNTGKSTLLENDFDKENSVYFDLLNQDLFSRLEKRPEELYEIVKGLPANKRFIIVDEIQKIPELLNVIHRLMKDKKHLFLMTGSSARKLKKEGVNLLAGRAFVYNLYPLSFLELGDRFVLNDALHWGTLPEVFDFNESSSKHEFLMAYAHTYLKEEIAAEQLVRNLPSFRRFLEVAAQCNGKIINYSNIARDVGIDDKTVKNYFSILEDTLVGHVLEPYHGSLRKRLQQSPKFYFFDTGVVRALAQLLSVPLLPSTNAYGNAFESYIINECIRLNSYFRKDYKFSFLRTVNEMEIDLIIERPGRPLLLIEIKSTKELEERLLKNFFKLCKEFPKADYLCLSCDPYAKKWGEVRALPWQNGLKEIFLEDHL